MLERLETYNFKSYKGHQVIGPFKSFTCTIGPNGAGKSNVMDAISFVLGVRSAQLRSNQLRDLIYRAGARHEGDRDEGEGVDEEMGNALNENGHGVEDARDAWVLAVYVDAEEKEWQFRRSITLAGHSEYRINGETTTAAKYNKVLESHGILVKAKNFLVFQGDVEAVASQSPKDLTKLIEQISGSADLKDEYDRAKAVQDKAVETSTHNYVKRRGVNAEVKQFKEQKSEAEKFEQLRADRDEAVVRHLLWKLYHINNEMSTATEEIDALSESLAGLRAEQAKHEASLKSARKEVASAQKAALKQEKEVKKREKDVEDKKPELAEIDEKITHVKRKIAKAQETAATVVREKKDKQGKVASLQSELARFEAVFAQQREDQRKTLASKGMTLSEDDLKEYNVLKADSAKKAVQERQELEKLERELRTKRSEMASVQDRLQQARNTQQRLADEDATYSERRSRMDARVASLSQDLARVKRELQDMQTERTKFNQQQTELDEKLQDVYRKLQQAEADRKESTKETRFKELLEDLKRSFGSDAVKGRISDLCKPSSRKYDTAVSITLGRDIDSIVVDTHATGVQCMNYLRENRKGTATFLPLDTLTPKPVNDKFRNYARGARLALDIIEYDAMYERAMLHACANTLICDNMEIAKHVSYEKGQEVKAVTLDGSMIHKSGLMTGGFDARGTGGRRWDEQEVTNLNRQREQYQNRMKELQSKRPREQHDDRLIAEINKLQSSLTSDREDLAVTKNKLKDITENLKHVDEQIKNLSAQVEKGTAGIEERSGRLDQLKTVVARAEDEVFASFCQRIGVRNIREYESKQLKDAQAHGEANLKLETTIARVRNQRTFESEQLESISDRLQVLTKSITSEQVKLADLESAKAEAEAALKELSARIDEVKATASAAQAALEAKTAELEQVKKGAAKSGRGFDRAFKEIASWNDTIEKLASERFAIYRRCKLEEIDLPLNKGRLDKVPVEEKLRDSMAMDVDEENDEESAVEGTQTARKVDDYGIELDFGSLTEDETENASDAAEKELLDRIVELQGEIDRMSPNMKAIDRLDEVEAKLAGISKEFEDARKTAKDAKDAFNDVKDRRCALFNKAYDHISERIDSVYKDLTKGKAAPMGGVAYLSLEDNDEPYLHGIKYHAMPPMKRFRDMDQLSGGEKTMAALALLFAIHSYKPSPFFVLDEVDASLDNSNVSKIAEYVRSRASKDFQFIVISLKNTFWERAQGLVGIYRDVDARSSKVLTLDLERYAET